MSPQLRRLSAFCDPVTAARLLGFSTSPDTWPLEPERDRRTGELRPRFSTPDKRLADSLKQAFKRGIFPITALIRRGRRIVIDVELCLAHLREQQERESKP